MSQEETQATEGAKLEETTATATVEQSRAEEPKEQAEPATDWKANSRKWEDRAKSNKEQLDATLKELEEVKASQATNTNEQLEQANAKIAELQLKIKVSKETGVPVELLQGSDEDAITASANALTSYAQSFAKSTAAYPLDKGGAAHSTAGNVEDIADPVARVQARARTLL